VRDAGVRVVAAVEATKGLLILVVGAGLLSLIHREPAGDGGAPRQGLHLNPASRTPRVFSTWPRS